MKNQKGTQKDSRRQRDWEAHLGFSWLKPRKTLEGEGLFENHALMVLIFSQLSRRNGW